MHVALQCPRVSNLVLISSNHAHSCRCCQVCSTLCNVHDILLNQAVFHEVIDAPEQLMEGWVLADNGFKLDAIQGDKSGGCWIPEALESWTKVIFMKGSLGCWLTRIVVVVSSAVGTQRLVPQKKGNSVARYEKGVISWRSTGVDVLFVGFSVLEDVMMVSHENWEDVGCGMWLQTWCWGCRIQLVGCGGRTSACRVHIQMVCIGRVGVVVFLLHSLYARGV